MITSRQNLVLSLYVQGHTYGYIAEALAVSKNTVKTTLGRIRRKLGGKTRAQLIVWFQSIGQEHAADSTKEKTVASSPHLR